jgi:hypothetical protein
MIVVRRIDHDDPISNVNIISENQRKLPVFIESSGRRGKNKQGGIMFHSCWETDGLQSENEATAGTD